MTADIRALIDHDRQELSGDFCRGCGYCMPCPQGIQINNCARMSQMIRRAPSADWLTPEWQERMLARRKLPALRQVHETLPLWAENS